MKFDIEKVKPDFSNVRTDDGQKVCYVYDTKTNTKYPIIVQIEGKGLLDSSNGSSLRLVDEPKLIDWSKLPVDTLVEIEKGKRRIHSNREYAAAVFGNGADSITGKGQGTGLYEKIKLIENPKFTYWPGGDCPVPEGVNVEAVCRCGAISRNPNRWIHDMTHSDVIAYRILGASDGYSPFFQGREF